MSVVVVVVSGPPRRLMKKTVVGIVQTTGPCVLGRVLGPDGNGDGRRLVRWTFGFLVVGT